jgi:hypothetical protein
MADTPGPHTPLARHSEAAARGWAVLVIVLLAVTTPVLYLQHSNNDDGGLYVEEPSSLWSALGDVLLAPLDDFNLSNDDSPETGAGDLIAGRIGVVLLWLGIVLAVAIAVRWLSSGDLDDVPARERWVGAALLLAGAAGLAITAAAVGVPDQTYEVGLDTAAGLLVPLALAGVLLAPPDAARSFLNRFFAESS